MDTINVCIMTRNRLKRLIESIRLIKENTEGVEYRLSILFDDDRESYDYCYSLRKIIGYECYLYSPQQECVMMTNNCFRLTKALKLNHFVFLNDDMEVQKGWLKNAMRDFKEAFPDDKGVVSFNMLPRGGDAICVAGLTSVSYVEECLNDNFFDMTFVHNEADGEFSYRSMFLNKFKWSKSAQVLHNHYLVDGALMDKTYTDSQQFYGYDLERRIKMFQSRGWNDKLLKRLVLKQKTKKEVFIYYIKEIIKKTKKFLQKKKIVKPVITRLN
jgi:hypothetical protein